MNKQLREFARSELKTGLAKCTEKQVRMFKLMYSEPTDPRKRTPEVVDRIKASDVEQVVDDMPDEMLDRAMEQVNATLLKQKGKL